MTICSSPDRLSFTAVSSTTWAANGFSTDNNTYQLSDVVLALEGVSTTGTLTVSLYSNNAGTPNVDLATLGTIADSVLSTSSFTQQTVPGGNFTLLPNTSYFIVLSGSTVGSPDADWERENGDGGTGVAGQAWGVRQIPVGPGYAHSFHRLPAVPDAGGCHYCVDAGAWHDYRCAGWTGVHADGTPAARGEVSGAAVERPERATNEHG